MNADSRRAGDQRLLVATALTAKRTSHSFWRWAEHHHIDSLGVIATTLWLTVRVVEWALDFPYDIETKLSGTEKAAILGAVLTPWGIMQGLMFKFYVDLKGRNGRVEPLPAALPPNPVQGITG